MLNLKLNLKHTGIEQKAIMKYKENVEQIHKELHKRANDDPVQRQRLGGFGSSGTRNDD